MPDGGEIDDVEEASVDDDSPSTTSQKCRPTHFQEHQLLHERSFFDNKLTLIAKEKTRHHNTHNFVFYFFLGNVKPWRY
jgi:hypothetical protein